MHPCVDCTALGNRWNSSRKLTRFSAKTLGIMPTIIQLKNPRPLAPPTTFGQENPEVGVARGHEWVWLTTMLAAAWKTWKTF